MKRRTGLIATLTAFFVLQAPICALACVENPAPDSAAVGHSCHDESSGPSPAEEPASHEGCGCELAPEAFASQASDSNLKQTHLHVAPVRRGPDLSAAFESAASSIARNIDLPPPDILLVKSTLLI